MFSESNPIILKPVANGWIVQVPPAPQNSINEIMPGMSPEKLQEFFKSIATGLSQVDDDPVMAEHKRMQQKQAEDILNAATKGIVQRDPDTYIFDSFSEVLKFLSEEFLPTDDNI